jgi:hypothetical protein
MVRRFLVLLASVVCTLSIVGVGMAEDAESISVSEAENIRMGHGVFLPDNGSNWYFSF